MKIVIATPVYPPEIAEPARYTKELAQRLAQKHQITIIAYTRLPEKIPGVKIITINKERPLLVRLFLYFVNLFGASRHTDIIYAQNGASVELPAALVSFLTHRPLIIHLGDKVAHKLATEKKLLGLIERLALRQSHEIITNTPPLRPEVLPWAPSPTAEFENFNKSWDTHIEILEKIFQHAK